MVESRKVENIRSSQRSAVTRERAKKFIVPLFQDLLIVIQQDIQGRDGNGDRGVLAASGT